jgi:hypothetical protein
MTHVSTDLQTLAQELAEITRLVEDDDLDASLQRYVEQQGKDRHHKAEVDRPRSFRDDDTQDENRPSPSHTPSDNVRLVFEWTTHGVSRSR